MKKNNQALGKQFLAELYKCEPEILNNMDIIAAVLCQAAEISGATVIDKKFHKFSPQGISGLVLISESHLAIHTWPEHNFASVDLFTCGSKFDSGLCIKFIQDKLKSKKSKITKIDRGVLPT